VTTLLPKSLAENIAFVFTNVPSPLAWQVYADTIPDVLRNAPRFLLDNPVGLEKKYLALRKNSKKKKLRTVMRRAVRASEEKALEMLVKLFDWLDGLGHTPHGRLSTFMTRLGVLRQRSRTSSLRWTKRRQRRWKSTNSLSHSKLM
jgi:hypothetical protein